MASEPPQTPPRQVPPAASHKSPITPEQVRRMEEQRLKAKALRAQKSNQNESSTTYTPDLSNAYTVGQKRPHDYIQTSSTSGPAHRDARATPSQSTANGHAPRRPHDEIQAARKFTKYVEYDFSKMTDTKGGFLTAEDDPHNKALHAPNQEDKPAHMTLAEWERHQLLKKLRDQRAGPFEPGIGALRREGKVCRECGSLEIDWQWEQVYDCRVCSSCKEKYPEKYSQLTKTEAKQDYMLTDSELNDRELFPRMEKPNPHKSTWNNMQLYLRYQLEEFAFSERKWGSAEKLDEEYERRVKDKKAKKEAKFRNKLLDLKKRTRVEAFKRGREQNGSGGGAQFGDKISTRRDKHEHEWGRPFENEDGITVKKCVECGMDVEELEF